MSMLLKARNHFTVYILYFSKMKSVHRSIRTVTIIRRDPYTQYLSAVLPSSPFNYNVPSHFTTTYSAAFLQQKRISRISASLHHLKMSMKQYDIPAAPFTILILTLH